MTAAHMEILTKLAKKYPEVKKAFDSDKRPERVLQQYKSITPLFDALKYYDRLSKEYPNNSEASRISGAVAGAAAKNRLSHFGKGLVIVGCDIIIIGGGEILAAPVTAGVSVLTGAGTIVIGLGTVAFGEWNIKNSDEVAYNVAVGWAGVQQGLDPEGLDFKIIKKGITGLFTRKSPDSDEYKYVSKYEFVTATAAEQAAYRREYEKILAEDDTLSASEKFELLDRVTKEQNAAQSLKQQSVNVAVLANNNALFEQIVHKDSMTAALSKAVSMTPLGDLINTPLPIKLKEGEEGFEYNWNVLDPNGEVKLWRSPLIQWMAENGGVLDKSGKFNITAEDINKFPSPGAGHVSRTSKLQSHPTGDLTKMLSAILGMNAKEVEDLNKIKGQLTVTLASGAKITAGEALSILVEDYLAKQKQQAIVRNYETIKAASDLVTRCGQMIGSKSLIHFGQTTSILTDMSFSIMRMSSGDMTASISFFNSVLSMVGLFKKDQIVDFNLIILEQLQEISQQIEALGEQIRQSHMQLSEQIYSLHRLVVKEFSALATQIYVNQIILSRRLHQIENSMVHLSQQMHDQIQQLWFADLQGIQFFVQNYYVRIGNLNLLTFEDYHRSVEVLINWITQKSALSNSNGAHLYNRHSQQHCLEIMQQADPTDILGFLIQVASNELNFRLPAELPVINPNVWLLAASQYLKLIENVDAALVFERDPTLMELRRVFQNAKNILVLSRQIRMSQPLFAQLLNRYESSLWLINDNVQFLSTAIDNKQVNVNLEGVLTEERSKYNLLKPISYYCDAINSLPGNVAKHENVTAIQRATNWNQNIANDKLVKFNQQYKDDLRKELDWLEGQGFKAQLPMALFLKVEDFLLPVSVLFNTANPVALPRTLLIAEKIGRGRFKFIVIPSFVGQYVNYTVTIEYHFNKQQISVATVSLDWLITSELVNTMNSLATMHDAKYGAEWANKYKQNVDATIATIEKILGWSNASITKIHYHELENNPHYQMVVQEVDKIDKSNFAAIAKQIRQGIPENNAIAEYAESFDQIQEALNHHELTVLYLRAFAQIAVFPESLVTQMQQLWDRDKIIDYLSDVANSKDAKPVRFQHTIEYHLSHTSNAENPNWVPVVSIVQGAFADILESINTFIWDTITRSKSSIEGFAVEQFIHVLHARAIALNEWHLKTHLKKLNLDDLDDYLPQKISEEVFLPPQAYNAIQAEDLLDAIRDKNTTLLLPTYYPFDRDQPQFAIDFLDKEITDAFETVIEQLQEKDDKSSTPKTIMLPILYEKIYYLTYQSPIAQKGWLSLLTKFSKEQNHGHFKSRADGQVWSILILKVTGENNDQLSAHFLNPIGLKEIHAKSIISHAASRGDEVDASIPAPVRFSDDYSEMNVYAVPIMKYLYPKIPSHFKKITSYISVERQISETDWRDSGVVMIRNAQDWLNSNKLTLLPPISPQQITTLRIEQMQILRQIDLLPPTVSVEPKENISDIFTAADIAYFTGIGLLSIPDSAHLVFAACTQPNQPRLIEVMSKDLTLETSSGAAGIVNIKNFEGTAGSTKRLWHFADKANETKSYNLSSGNNDITGLLEKTGLLSIANGLSLVYTHEPDWAIQEQDQILSGSATGSSHSIKAGLVKITFTCTTKKFTTIKFEAKAPALNNGGFPHSQDKYSHTKKEVVAKLEKLGFFKVPEGYCLVVTRTNEADNQMLQRKTIHLSVTGSGSDPDSHIGISNAKGETEKFEALVL